MSKKKLNDEQFDEYVQLKKEKLDREIGKKNMAVFALSSLNSSTALWFAGAAALSIGASMMPLGGMFGLNSLVQGLAYSAAFIGTCSAGKDVIKHGVQQYLEKKEVALLEASHGISTEKRQLASHERGEEDEDTTEYEAEGGEENTDK